MAQEPTDEELDRMFEAALAKEEARGQPAQPEDLDEDGPALVKGTISGIAQNDVFVDLGPRMQGVIHLQEFDQPPRVGQQFEFTVQNADGELWELSRSEARRLATWRELDPGRWVTAQVTGHNKGGLELKIGPVRAFCPISQIGDKGVEDLGVYVGQSMVCQVTEVNESQQRVVLSRRKVLEEERRKSREESVAALKVGQILRGTVEKLEAFGAFVNLGGDATGLLHVSNLSHQRVRHPSDLLKEGDVIEVQVLEIQDGGRRIGLGMKQLQAHPWDGIETRLHENQLVSGKVTRVEAYGAFVEVETGVEGLLHISQLGSGRVNRVQDVVNVGDRVTVRVTGVQPDEHRLSLSLLSERGARLGSEEDLDEAEADTGTAVFREGEVPRTGTNLGDLLRKAVEDGPAKDRKKRR